MTGSADDVAAPELCMQLVEAMISFDASLSPDACERALIASARPSRGSSRWWPRGRKTVSLEAAFHAVGLGDVVKRAHKRQAIALGIRDKRDPIIRQRP